MSTGNYDLLRSYYKELLPTMTNESWDLCESLLSVRTLKKGEMLVQEGQVCNHVSFINSGLIRMYFLAPDGREKIVGFCNERNYIADYRSFLTRQPSETCVQAMEATEVVETSYAGLQYLYQMVPEANILGRLIAEKLFIEMCAFSSSEMRSIDQRYNDLVSEQPWLMQRVPQYMIASYLGVTPEALSRIKARMNKKPSEKALI